jgi:hypothetical protein
MKRHAQRLLCGALICFAHSAQCQIKPTAMQKAGTHYTEGYPSNAAVLSDGTTVIVGKKRSNYSWDWGFVAWINPDGTLKHEFFLDEKTEGMAELNYIAVEPGTDNIYVAGYTMLWSGRFGSGRGVRDDDAILIKFDKNGIEQWTQVINESYRGPETLDNMNPDEDLCGVDFTPEGNIVTLSYQNDNGKYQHILYTFSPEGEALTRTLVSLPYSEFRAPSKFISAGDGSYWILCIGMNGDSRSPHLFRISEHGEILAAHLIAETSGCMLDDLKRMKNGNVLLTASMFGGNGIANKGGGFILCYSMDASLLWYKSYMSDFEAPHLKVTETDAGDILVVMYTPGNIPEFAGLPRSRCNITMAKLNPQGEYISKKSLLGLPHYQSTEGIAYYKGEVRLAIEGAVKPVNNTPPDHFAYFYNFIDF